MRAEDQRRLAGLPWQVPVEEWLQHGVIPLSIRRGESRHPVIFVERDGARYAIKETTPRMAEREIRKSARDPASRHSGTQPDWYRQRTHAARAD